MNTRIHYLYRDASNYKFSGSFVVKGGIGREHLQPFLHENGWFIPKKVGLNHLLTEPWDEEEDHSLHELCEFEVTEDRDCVCTAKELIRRFQLASKNWFGGWE